MVVIGGGFTSPIRSGFRARDARFGLASLHLPAYDPSGADDQDGVGNTITVYAICASEPAGYEVVSPSALAFGDGGYGGWSCPAGTASGGGFRGTDPVSVSAPGTPNSV
jgi:hypothetical protein